MTKKDFVKLFQENMFNLNGDPEMKENINFNQKETSKLTDCFLETITQALEESGSIQIVGWGTFELKTTAERIGRNPKTGEEIKILPKKVIKFKAGKTINERINKK